MAKQGEPLSSPCSNNLNQTIETMYNKIRNIASVALLLALSLPANAAPRSKADIMAAAKRALLSNSSATTPKARIATAKQMKVLKKNDAFTIIGSANGGFAIISNDDLVPEVIGYSDQPFNEDDLNDNFRWFLQTAEASVKEIIATGQMVNSIKPDTKKFSQKVDNFVTAKWGQTKPFNDECPTASASGTTWQGYTTSKNAVTGCVATAMAQILHHYKWPANGTGTVKLPVEQPDKTKKVFVVNFEDHTYDWKNMKNEYKIGQYKPEEAKAVAVLMRDCGFAAGMEYHIDASGAVNKNAEIGLRKYFGYDKVELIFKSDYFGKNKEWMEKIFTELNAKHPIFYGASDKTRPQAGHAFVLTGYNEEGKVYVNWGWDGKSNGFYDISLLNPPSYQFSEGQSMIIGIVPNRPAKDQTVEKTVTQAGNLKNQITTSEIETLQQLVVKGTINSTDIKYLRSLAGRNEKGELIDGTIETIDLSGATIVAGGEDFLVDNDKKLNTANNEIPERAFYGCQGITKIVLPTSITKIGDGAFGGISTLETIEIPMGADKQYKYEDNILYTKDGSEIIAVLPMKEGKLEVAKTIKKVHAYGLAGCQRITSIVFPETIQEIGDKAFEGSFAYKAIRMYAKTPCKLGKEVFADINKGITPLEVPLHSEKTYMKTAQWSDFYIGFDNIKPFGTDIIVRNASRAYGDENEKFGWKTEGDDFVGTPLITCAATKTSPVGTYDINIERGNVVSDMLQLVKGTLTIFPAKATITVDTKGINLGDAYTPTFTVTQLKNNETASVLTKQPTFVYKDGQGNVVTALDKVGVYTITASGAEAQNYEFEYVEGKVNVFSGPTAIKEVEISATDNAPYYTLSGVRIEKPVKGGVYIHNNKKVVVK